MCVCVNFKYFGRCNSFHDLDKNHEVEYLNSYPDFNANNPLIHESLGEENN